MQNNEAPMLGAWLLVNIGSEFPRAAHVVHEDFANLYVRAYKQTITIAVVQSKEPGRGAWRRLVRSLRRAYPNVYLYVESVGNLAFAQHLRQTGFEKSHQYCEEHCADFVLKPEIHYDGVSANENAN